jgi:Mrp family chromosome partitioning ATPase
MTTTRQQTGTQSHSEAQEAQDKNDAILKQRMEKIGRKLLVLSGKGGVGKSTVAVNLAVALSRENRRVGLLDVDVHGPSVPTLLKLPAPCIHVDGGRFIPAQVNERLMVMSLGFMLPHAKDPVIWRGPRKYHAIRQFLQDVAWGDLDFLVIDCPPGTGDEPLSVAQMVGRPAAAIVVTTPQRVAINDVRRCVTFCQSVALPLLGIIENMSGYVCPQCGRISDLFASGGGESLAAEMQVPFLGRLPFDPSVVVSGDAGVPFVTSTADGEPARRLAEIVKRILGGAR